MTALLHDGSSSVQKDDDQFVQSSLRSDGLLLRFASDRLKGDSKTVICAVKQNGLALQYSKLRSGIHLAVYYALKNNGMALEFVSFSEPAAQFLEEPLSLVAVMNNGLALQFCNYDRCTHYHTTLCALMQNGLALKYAGIYFKSNEKVALLAIRNNAAAINYVNYAMRSDEEFIKKAVVCNAEVSKFVC